MDDGTSSGGIGFLGLLAILFIGLKLTGNIDWSWWWVLSPLWIPALVAIVIAIIVGAAALVLRMMNRKRDRARRARDRIERERIDAERSERKERDFREKERRAAELRARVGL